MINLNLNLFGEHLIHTGLFELKGISYSWVFKLRKGGLRQGPGRACQVCQAPNLSSLSSALAITKLMFHLEPSLPAPLLQTGFVKREGQISTAREFTFYDHIKRHFPKLQAHRGFYFLLAAVHPSIETVCLSWVTDAL